MILPVSEFASINRLVEQILVRLDRNQSRCAYTLSFLLFIVLHLRLMDLFGSIRLISLFWLRSLHDVFVILLEHSLLVSKGSLVHGLVVVERSRIFVILFGEFMGKFLNGLNFGAQCLLRVVRFLLEFNNIVLDFLRDKKA